MLLFGLTQFPNPFYIIFLVKVRTENKQRAINFLWFNKANLFGENSVLDFNINIWQ